MLAIEKDLQAIGETLDDLAQLNSNLQSRYNITINRIHRKGWQASRLHKACFQTNRIGLGVLEDWFTQPVTMAKQFLSVFK